MSDLIKPEWRNTDTFIGSLKDDAVQTKIACYQAAQHSPTNYGTPAPPATVETEAKRCLPELLTGLRIVDIADHMYWLASFIGIFLFTFGEFIIFAVYFDFVSDNILAAEWFVWPLIFIVLLTFCHSIYIGLHLLTPSAAMAIKSKLHIPVSYDWIAIIITILLLFLNFLLVLFSGLWASPFLPSLIYVAMTIISAPRENSKVIIWLSVITFLLVLAPILIFPQITPLIDVLGSEDFMNNVMGNAITKETVDKIAVLVNTISLIFTVGMVILLRQINAKRIL